MNVNIHIRVNVDNHNLNDFKALYSYFEQIAFLTYKNFKVYSALIQNNEEVQEQDKNDVDFLSESEYLKGNENMGTISSYAGYNIIYKKIHLALTSKRAIPLTAVHCTAQTGEYVFTPLKEIYPCWEVIGNKKFQIGSIREDSIIWNKEELEKWHSHDVTSFTCKYCKYIFLCGGGCLAMKNNQCLLLGKIITKAVNAVFNGIYANISNK